MLNLERQEVPNDEEIGMASAVERSGTRRQIRLFLARYRELWVTAATFYGKILCNFGNTLLGGSCQHSSSSKDS